jgi:hypothetical protein
MTAGQRKLLLGVIAALAVLAVLSAGALVLISPS